MRSYEATSERMCPDDYQDDANEYLIYLFHLATYDFAAERVTGVRVLDFGCGTGYGVARIADVCEQITGVDISSEAISYARDRFRAAKVQYELIAPVEQQRLPVADGSFDAVLSFQVIEHVPDPAAYLTEIARVLAPGGILILATPDRRTRLWRGQRPWNRFHLTECSPSQLAALVSDAFGPPEILGMGTAPDLLSGELRRCRRLRMVAYPFTFPAAPEIWRQWGLGALKRLDDRRRKRPARLSAIPETATLGDGVAPSSSKSRTFDEHAIAIGPDVWPSTNVVLVARRR